MSSKSAFVVGILSLMLSGCFVATRGAMQVGDYAYDASVIDAKSARWSPSSRQFADQFYIELDLGTEGSAWGSFSPSDIELKLSTPSSPNSVTVSWYFPNNPRQIDSAELEHSSICSIQQILVLKDIPALSQSTDYQLFKLLPLSASSNLIVVSYDRQSGKQRWVQIVALPKTVHLHKKALWGYPVTALLLPPAFVVDLITAPFQYLARENVRNSMK